MFLREGSQLGAAIIAAFCITLTLTSVSGIVQAADGVVERRLELPREILPWRRDIERRASMALTQARRNVSSGNVAEGEKQLQELVKDFPQTHAAADGKDDLIKLHEKKYASATRSNLGIQPVSKKDSISRLSPVAGWQTHVRTNASSLHEALIEAAGDRVFFDNGSTKLSSRATIVLKKQARWLNAHPNITVLIAGHADDQGSSHSNMRLSHDRAVVVREFLMQRGISGKRLHVFGHGKNHPIAICDVRTCAAQNRRVVTELRSTDSAMLLPH
jgi:outer membrane protein OmpA-like peptidoglycan-associated protein